MNVSTVDDSDGHIRIEENVVMPDLEGQPPPPRVYPRLIRRLRIVMWLAAVGGLVVLAGGGYEYHRMQRLGREGKQVPGTLVDSSTLNTGKGRTSYHLMLDYQPPNSEITYRKEFFVAQSIYDQALKAGQVPVTYLPSDPTLSTASQQAKGDTEPLAIGGGLLLVAVGIWAYRRWQVRRVMRYVLGE